MSIFFSFYFAFFAFFFVIIFNDVVYGSIWWIYAPSSSPSRYIIQAISNVHTVICERIRLWMRKKAKDSFIFIISISIYFCLTLHGFRNLLIFPYPRFFISCRWTGRRFIVCSKMSVTQTTNYLTGFKQQIQRSCVEAKRSSEKKRVSGSRSRCEVWKVLCALLAVT